MINTAIVGLGGIGNRHADCYSINEKTRLVAVCDIIKERADKVAKKHNCQAYYSVESLLDSGLEINAASICTAGEENGSHHYKPTMELLNAGISILGEKPISNDIGEAKEMVALAKAKNIPFAIDHNHRFTPAARKAKEWLDEGRLGELNSINMRMWINNPNESSEHFHIRALHPHSFDVMRFFCGKVSQVHAFFKKGAGRAIWSNVQVNLLYENGVIGHLLGSYDGGGPGTPWGLETCEIVGQEARIIIEEACEVLKFQPRHSIESETYHHLGGMKDFSETFQSRIDQWIEDLSNGVPPDRIDGKSDDSLHAQQIIEAAIESWSAKSVISL